MTRRGVLFLVGVWVVGCGIQDELAVYSEQPTVEVRRDAMPGPHWCTIETDGQLGYSCKTSPDTVACCGDDTGIAYCCPSGTVCCPGLAWYSGDQHCCAAGFDCKVKSRGSQQFHGACEASACPGLNNMLECCSPVGPARVPKLPMSNIEHCPNRVAIPGHTPTPNGCGTTAHPLPHEYGKADFTLDCNGHDNCFETCASVKATCDEAFVAAMAHSCALAYSAILEVLDYALCERVTGVIGRAAIGSSIGIAAYNDAQKLACRCCP